MARKWTICDVAQAASLRVAGAACSRVRRGAGGLRRRSFSHRHPRLPGLRAGSPGHPQAGSLRYAASQFGNRFLFQGRDRDPDTGLYNFRHRAYSPTLGRFLQVDPIGNPTFAVSISVAPRNAPDQIGSDGPNLYQFVKNRPLSKIDPYGLMTVESVGECWETVEDFYCGHLTGALKVCCEKVMEALFGMVPGAETRACQVIWQKCTWCCRLNFEDDDRKKALCVANCKAKMAQCLVSAGK